jgi:hypothetical protein
MTKTAAFSGMSVRELFPAHTSRLHKIKPAATIRRMILRIMPSTSDAVTIAALIRRTCDPAHTLFRNNARANTDPIKHPRRTYKIVVAKDGTYAMPLRLCPTMNLHSGFRVSRPETKPEPGSRVKTQRQPPKKRQGGNAFDQVSLSIICTRLDDRLGRGCELPLAAIEGVRLFHYDQVHDFRPAKAPPRLAPRESGPRSGSAEVHF